MNKTVSRWLVWLLLAALLAFGSEVLLWTNPFGRSPLDSVLLFVGYIAVSVLLLDVMRRYKVRDFFGLMVIAGVYGLLNGFLLNPALTLFDIPRTLVTRVMGAHTLLGLEMLVMFLVITGGGKFPRLRWIALAGSPIVGLAWGTWVRWSPTQADVVATDFVSQETMIAVGAFGVAVIAVLMFSVYRFARDLTPDDMQLTLREAAVLLLVLTLIGFIRIMEGALDFPAIVLTAILLTLSGAILWFRRGTKLPITLQAHFPMTPVSLVWIAAIIGLLFGGAVFAYEQPLYGDAVFSQLVFVVYGFTLYGLAWLPFVSVMLGVRAYMRQVQSSSL